MKKFPCLFYAMLLVSMPAFAASDFLAQKQFTFTASSPDSVVEKTVADLRAVFRRYEPAIDSGTKITRPLEVGGTAARPTFSVGVKKCVAFVCQEADIEAAISIREVNGACRADYVLTADLRRSSDSITDNYDAITVNICYKASGRSASIEVSAAAERAPGYSSGFMSREILKMLALQIPPMATALEKSLKANGGRNLRQH